MGLPAQARDLSMADCTVKPLTEAELAEIERMARENTGEPYRGPPLALVNEVRRLREVMLGREVTSGR